MHCVRSCTFKKYPSISVNFYDCFCCMLSICFSILQCMLIDWDANLGELKTALCCHRAVSFCALEYKMHFLIVCSHIAVKVRWCGEQGQAEAVTISSFLGTFWWWCEDREGCGETVNDVSGHWLLALLWGSRVLICVWVPAGHWRKMLYITVILSIICTVAQTGKEDPERGKVLYFEIVFCYD